jgi:hypothetical protein
MVGLCNYGERRGLSNGAMSARRPPADLDKPLFRSAQLAAEPLCRMCLAAGQIQAANIADHVVPHRGDLDLFWNGALQSLCATCLARHWAAAGEGARGK